MKEMLNIILSLMILEMNPKQKCVLMTFWDKVIVSLNSAKMYAIKWEVQTGLLKTISPQIWVHVSMCLCQSSKIPYFTDAVHRENVCVTTPAICDKFLNKVSFWTVKKKCKLTISILVCPKCQYYKVLS